MVKAIASHRLATRWRTWGIWERLQGSRRLNQRTQEPQSTEATSALEVLISPAGLPAIKETEVRVKDLSREVIALLCMSVVVVL